MSEKHWNGIYIALFFLVCLIPCAGMLIFGSGGAGANEVPARVPAVMTGAGGPNGAFFDELSSYIADNFAYRSELVTARSKLFAALGASGEEDVVLGREGWLFFADTLDDYTGRAVLSGRDAFRAARSLALMEEYAVSQGAGFLFTVAPNKNSLYGGYMPGGFTAFSGDRSIDMLEKALTEQGISYLNLYELFYGRMPLYFKGDTHWNSYGAALVSDAILERLGYNVGEGFAGGRFSVEAVRLGDLYEMLYPAGSYLEDDYVYEGALDFSYVKPIRSADDITIRTQSAGEGKGGSLLMFRDSFGNSLFPFLAARFENAYFSRKIDFNLGLISETGATAVVIELVERNITQLVETSPVFPAPLRDIAPVAESDARSRISIGGTGKLSGFVEIRGWIDASAIDSASPIYIMAGKTVYEATLSGASDDFEAFTAYLPEGAELESISVLALIDGTISKTVTEKR